MPILTVITISFLFWSLLPDAGPGFSHRKHLARGAACEACHGAAPSSTDAGDTLLPEETDCRRCHEESVSMPPSPGGKRTYRFNHQLHLGFGNVAPVLAGALDKGTYLAPPGDMRRFLDGGNACAACHRGVNEVDLASALHLPRMADCLVCHSAIDLPYSCAKCHTGDAVLRPASHTASFGDSHSSREAVPDKSGCRVCHGVRFTCMGCH